MLQTGDGPMERVRPMRRLGATRIADDFHEINTQVYCGFGRPGEPRARKAQSFRGLAEVMRNTCEVQCPSGI